MLQRLIHKPPVPIDPIPLDKFIFDKYNRIRKYVLPICNNLDIDPQEIYPKTFQDFIGKEPSSNILILRYNEWEAQRRHKIDELREHVKDYLRARQKTKASVKGYSPQTTQETGSSPRREHYISVNFDTAPRMTTGGSPTNLQVTLESPRNMKQGGEFDRFVTGSSRDYSTGRPILAAISRASYSMTSKRTLKDGDSRDDIIINDEGEDDIKRNFKRHLKHRIVNKERQVNASVLVTRKEEEFRNKMKEEYLERERKWNEKKQKLMLTKRQPIVRLDDHDKERKWKLKLEEKEEAINAIRRQVEINERLAMSEKKRKEENEKKFERIKERNRITQQRCQSVAERIVHQSGEKPSPVPADLQEIEKKLIESQERKEKLMRQKKTNIGRASGDITEKLKKIQEKKEQEEQELRREIAKKLEKVKLKEASTGTRKLTNDTSQTKSGVQQRLEEIRREEKRKEKKLAEELMMKEKQVLERLSEKRSSLEEYIAERRERRQQRFNHTKINTSVVEEGYNKWIESTNRSYKEKLEEIKNKKSWREQQVKALERIERKSVREDMRISYSFDQKC